MEKSKLNLIGREPHDVIRELNVFFMNIGGMLNCDDPALKEKIRTDMGDRLRGFRNYFAQSLDEIERTIK